MFGFNYLKVYHTPIKGHKRLFCCLKICILFIVINRIQSMPFSTPVYSVSVCGCWFGALVCFSFVWVLFFFLLRYLLSVTTSKQTMAYCILPSTKNRTPNNPLFLKYSQHLMIVKGNKSFDSAVVFILHQIVSAYSLSKHYHSMNVCKGEPAA